MVARHGAAVLRVANQFSLCHDDALDAYQRAFEIYLRKLETVDPATEGAWLRVVVKHKAMAIHRARLESVDHDAVDLDTSVSAGLREVDDAVAGGERVDRSVEALRALKPDEARALLLKAEGLSYQEIGRHFGWSYTKVNRSITEGRARFMKAFSGIEAGEACERHEAALAALAAGTATSAEVVSIRPHLRHCATCRAAVREMRFSRGRRLVLVLPLGLADPAAGTPRREHEHAVRGLGQRRAARAGGDPDRAVPERCRRGCGLRRHRRAAGAADHRAHAEHAEDRGAEEAAGRDGEAQASADSSGRAHPGPARLRRRHGHPDARGAQGQGEGLAQEDLDDEAEAPGRGPSLALG